ncbi:hypothetical protein CRUP_009997 [Coryphaenoides rupestris]|nr:hypothetical protein CRUP_009997 [Coryphaenoides rupestris]
MDERQRRSELVAQERSGHTAIYSVNLLDGKYTWKKVSNGTGSPPSPRDKLSCWVFGGRAAPPPPELPTPAPPWGLKDTSVGDE